MQYRTDDLTLAEARALAVLRGCPEGSTEAALANIGVERAALDVLVMLEHAACLVQRCAPAGGRREIVIRRYMAVTS